MKGEKRCSGLSFLGAQGQAGEGEGPGQSDGGKPRGGGPGHTEGAAPLPAAHVRGKGCSGGGRVGRVLPSASPAPPRARAQAQLRPWSDGPWDAAKLQSWPRGSAREGGCRPLSQGFSFCSRGTSCPALPPVSAESRGEPDEARP